MNPPPLIQALLNPGIYAHPTESIRCRETHISWVILTGPYAYKIKKPVDFGFLDFSTLDKRRFYCQEELRLNRRLAPPLYLKVVAITGSPACPRIDGDGNPLEYAVKMRQFREEDLLAERAGQGDLQEDQVESLARLIARFHLTAPRAGPGDPYGDPALLQTAARQNFAQINPDDPGDHTILAHLAAWTEAEFSRLQPLMTARRQQGWIRECHGDLHLGNIVLWHGRPLPFDCIEFNPELRWIDVISEIAFPVMDLCAYGFRPLGFRFLNDYLGLTGGYEGIRLLRYYLVYRAMVRAKIAHLSGRQSGAVDYRPDFRRYLSLARDLSQARQPALCITHGFSGSGKSHLSRRLAAELGALHLRSDVERKRLAGLEAGTESKTQIGRGIYRPDFTDRTYRHLWNVAHTILTAGFPVIVDATFLRRVYRDRFRDLARTLGVPFLILDFNAPDDILRQRILRRLRERHDPSDADLKVLAYQLQHHDPLHESEQAVTLMLETGKTPDLKIMLAACKARLRLE